MTKSSSTELVTHKSERSPDRAVLAGDDAPSMGDFSAACNHERDSIPMFACKETAKWAQVCVALQSKPCSLFIVAAVSIPTEPSTSRTSNKGSCQTMVPPYSSHRGNPFQCQSTIRHRGSRTQGLVLAVELYQTGSYPRTKVVIAIGGSGSTILKPVP